MTTPIQCHQTTEPGKAMAVNFVPSEYQLVCNIAPTRRPRAFLIIADTLTFTFAEDGSELLQFDAYTNSAKWTQANLSFPDVVESCRLSATPPPNDDNDRVNWNVVPKFSRDSNHGLLSIRFTQLPSQQFLRLAPNCVAGIDSDMCLVELIIGSESFRQ